jgi:hypothetical protein
MQVNEPQNRPPYGLIIGAASHATGSHGPAGASEELADAGVCRDTIRRVSGKPEQRRTCPGLMPANGRSDTPAVPGAVWRTLRLLHPPAPVGPLAAAARMLLLPGAVCDYAASRRPNRPARVAKRLLPRSRSWYAGTIRRPRIRSYMALPGLHWHKLPAAAT